MLMEALAQYLSNGSDPTSPTWGEVAPSMRNDFTFISEILKACGYALIPPNESPLLFQLRLQSVNGDLARNRVA